METRPAQPVEMRLRPRRKTFSDNIFPQENYDKMCRRQQRVIVIELSSSSSSSNHRNDHRCNELRLRHWQEKHAARSRTAYRVPRSMFVVVKVAARLQANWGCSWPGLARPAWSANDAKLMTICRNWTWSRVKEALQLQHLRHQDAPPRHDICAISTWGRVSLSMGKTELSLIAIANKFLA